jgi:hypothetical protein
LDGSCSCREPRSRSVRDTSKRLQLVRLGEDRVFPHDAQRVPVGPPTRHHRSSGRHLRNRRDDGGDDIQVVDGADTGADADDHARHPEVLGLDELVIGGAAPEAGGKRSLDELEQLGVEDADPRRRFLERRESRRINRATEISQPSASAKRTSCAERFVTTPPTAKTSAAR